jgi:hypothetical protein
MSCSPRDVSLRTLLRASAGPQSKSLLDRDPDARPATCQTGAAETLARISRHRFRSWFTVRVTTALFVIPLWLDLTAVAIGAIQGAMFAARLTGRRIDLLGVALIGVIVGSAAGSCATCC